MLQRQIISRPVGTCNTAPKALHTVPALRGVWSSTSIPGVAARSYIDEGDGYGRSGRNARGRQGDGRRPRGGGRGRSDEDAEWGDGVGSADLMSYSEDVSIPGMVANEASTSSSGEGRGEQRQGGFGYGRGYGRGGGGYERRGGGGGGRGYGRGGGERRWGGNQEQTPGEPGEGFVPEGGPEGQWRGGRGQGNWQGRRYGGGRGGGYGGGVGYEGTSAGGGEGGEGQRTWRGPRESLSPEVLAARAANAEAVRDAGDWRSLAAVLEARASSLDAENITVMMTKLARFGRPSSAADAPGFESLVGSLYGWVSSMAPSMRPKQLASCLWAVARLELFNAELVGALAERAAASMGNFTGYDYSNMVWAFARMNYSPGEEWLQQFVYWSERRLGGFRPVELANTVSSLARLGHVPPAAWLEAFTASVAKQASEFNTLEAVNTLFGLASLGYRGGPDPGAWLGPLLAGGQGVRAGAEGQAAAGAAGLAGAESLRVTDLTRTAWALTQFEWEPPREWLAAAMRGFVRSLRFCLPSDLSALSYSLAYLKTAPSADELKQLAAALPRSWGRMSGDEVANMAMSLALWQYTPASDRWLDELVIVARDKLPTCSADSLSKLVSALPMLGRSYRLDQVVAQAQGLLDAAAQAAEAPAEGYAEAYPEAQGAAEQQPAAQAY